MNAILIGRAEPNSPEWHALRADGIGASEIAAVVGLSPYVSAFALWHQKKGNLPDVKQSGPMEWGNRLEAAVIGKFADEHPEWEITPTPGTFANIERDWQRCNPDGLIGNGIDFPCSLLQVKTSRYGNGFGKAGTDEIPLHYRAQVLHEMDVIGAARTHLALLIGGNEYREYVIEADPEDQKTLREAGAAFWASLSAGDEPPLDCSDSTYRAVIALDPDMAKDEHVDLPSDLWAAYLKAKSDVTEAEGELSFAKAQILKAMRGVQFAKYAGQKVLRRQRSNGGTYHLREVS